ncbi:CvpA family protein [Burkholderia glumae]|uniref:CvpA family protein n=1 Tax=Burkholderia glumae TaxID=337 RepID=A0AAQ0BS46_BURGL|nr:CvpA family protein [Burkholderia glumae]ACR31262.1 CvpA family protein [Burkholderia glumae BGR1]AJY63179.1 colicin V production family protein [Burkholderia glumae LMG 2196 = ATCC 33617]KHJ64543.1 bacteriocin production protein [Burkholderia glumae]MCM2483407.1 CvpA family protein [Burkholderia glumae]MCM2511309.1 CvpA family protein [Burkholderia glumae]
MLTAFDYAVLAVIALSALRGAWRGFVSEIFGLIGWVAAFIVACRYVGVVLPFIPSTWPGGALTQWMIAFGVIVIGVVLVAGVANALLSRLAQVTGLGGVDRSLGLLFGLVRGVLMVLLLVAAAGLTELPKQDFWRNALLRPFAEQGVRELKPFLPDGLAAYIHI